MNSDLAVIQENNAISISDFFQLVLCLSCKCQNATPYQVKIQWSA